MSVRSIPHARTLMALGALVATAGAVVVGGNQAGATTEPYTVMARDAMSRTVVHGYGSAQVGSSYTVSPITRASVSRGAGHIKATRGSLTSMSLPKVRAADTQIRESFSLSALPRRGSVYIGLAMRRQSNGDGFRAYIRVLPRGVARVQLQQVQNHVAKALGTYAQLGMRVAAHRTFVLSAQATGSKAVSVSVRAYRAGAAAPRWQRTVTAHPGAALALGGAVGTLVGVSPTTASLTVSTDSLYVLGRKIPARAPQQNNPTPVTPPSTPAPSSSAPSTPAPSSSAPSTPAPSSSAPSTPAPSSSAPSTPAPSSSAPSTPAPSSSAPSTPAPSSSAPSTPAPSSSAPSTPAPSSSAPSTPAPSSSAPTTTPPTTTPPTTTPPNAPAIGSAPLGSTAYPIPADAIFIAPTGSDTAAGSKSAPMRTLAAAVRKAGNGATIVLRAGSYHEALSVPSNKSITVQSYPGEEAWLDGSVPVTDWYQSGSVWVHSGWTAEFNSSSSAGYVGSNYPMAGHPDQMWVDGTALTQVASAAAVTPGTFYADYTNNQLVIGADPNGHDLRASDLSIAMTVSSPNSTIRGIGVRRYADSVADLGVIRMGGKNDVLENDVFSDNAVTGAAMTKVGAIVRNVTFQRNGMLGLVANETDGILVTGVLADHNNTEHFLRAPVSGGVKITRTRGIEVIHNTFSNNDGPGLWLDESCYNSIITDNQMINNSNHGMSLEISDTSLIANNVVTGNGGYGLKINDSGHVRIWNNVIKSANHDIYLTQDFRRNANLSDPGHDKRQAQPDPTMPWIVNDIQIVNNVLGAPSNGSYEVAALDGSGQYTAAQMHVTVNSNRFAKGPTGTEFMWSTTPGKAIAYTTVAAYTAATNDGQLNTETSGGLLAAVGLQGVALPADIAAVLGVPVSSPPVGTFSN